jgi:hypothetical protein
MIAEFLKRMGTESPSDATLPGESTSNLGCTGNTTGAEPDRAPRSVPPSKGPITALGQSDRKDWRKTVEEGQGSGPAFEEGSVDL